MKRLLSLALAASVVGAAEVRANESELTGLQMDTRSGFRWIDNAADVAAIAFNNDASWPEGGLASAGYATADVTKMAGDDWNDPSSWTEVEGSLVVFGPAQREATFVWRPSSSSPYRLRLHQPNEETPLEVYFSVSDAPDFPSAIESATVALSSTKFLYDGTEKRPSVMSVTVGGTALVEGTDFVCCYSDNVEIGTAHVNLIGRGVWGGALAVPFSIVSVIASESTVSGLAMDLRTNEVLEVGVLTNLLPIAYNDDAAWPAGGVRSSGRFARLSAAPLGNGFDIVGGFAVFEERTGEGTTARPPTTGRVCLKLEFVKDGEVDDSETLTRKLILKPFGLVLLIR